MKRIYLLLSRIRYVTCKKIRDKYTIVVTIYNQIVVVTKMELENVAEYLKTHGYYDDGQNSTSSDSGLSEFDENFRKLQPSTPHYEEIKYNIIVVSSTGKSGLNTLIVPSCAARILSKITCLRGC